MISINREARGWANKMKEAEAAILALEENWREAAKSLEYVQSLCKHPKKVQMGRAVGTIKGGSTPYKFRCPDCLLETIE